MKIYFHRIFGQVNYVPTRNKEVVVTANGHCHLWTVFMKHVVDWWLKKANAWFIFGSQTKQVAVKYT
jgi:hypothetical protein